jgi:hypothetical protein
MKVFGTSPVELSPKFKPTSDLLFDRDVSKYKRRSWKQSIWVGNGSSPAIYIVNAKLTTHTTRISTHEP